MHADSRTKLSLIGSRRSTAALLLLLIAVLAMPLTSAQPVGIAAHPAAPSAVGGPAAAIQSTASAPLHLPTQLAQQVAQRINGGATVPSWDHGYIPWTGPGSPGFQYPYALTPAGVVARPASAGPASVGPGSSSDNFYLPGSDCSGWFAGYTFVPWISGSAITSVGMSNQTLLAAGGSMNQIFNVSTGSECISGGLITALTLLYGYGTVYRTADGGQQWTQYPIAPNATLWTQNSSLTNGSMTTGNEYIAGNLAGDAAVISGYAPACVSIPVSGIPCGSPHGQYAPWGFAISLSNDGGYTWSNATQLSGVNGLWYFNPSATCQNAGFTPGVAVNNIPENPWVVMDNDTIVAGWDVLQQGFDQATCQFQVNAQVQVVYSTDGGATFSAPMNVTNDITDSVSLALGPTGSHTVYLAAEDSGNFSSSTESIYFSFQKSTNSGATWTTEGDILTVPVGVSGLASAPDQYGSVQRPNLAADNWASSPYNGNLYLVWQDNDSGGSTGFSTIGFSKSTNGGSTWSAPVYVTGQGSAFNYNEPTIAVGPDGTIWINFYGVNQSGAANGAYNVYGVGSTDGGATWSSIFRITDTSSSPGTTPTPNGGTPQSITDLGFYMGATATTAGDVPIWSDCRNFNCGSGFDVQHYVATVELLNFSTTAPPTSTPTASIQTDGSTVTSSLPATLGWDWGSSHLVQVPLTLPYNASAVEAFTGFAGLTTTTAVSTTVVVNQLGVGLEAMYTPEPATFIEGTIQPLVPGVTLTLDALPQPLTSNATEYFYTAVVPQNGQAHTLVASAPNYQTQTVVVGTNSQGVTWQNFTLVRDTGTLRIQLSASQGFAAWQSLINNATVTVNDVPAGLANSAGLLSVTEPFGPVFVNATLNGFLVSETPANPVTVVANQVKTVSFSFTGGWINGTVVPVVSQETLRINGTVVPIAQSGVFTEGVPGGSYSLTATAKGYNLSTIDNIVVVAGATNQISVSLTNHGYIAGTIQPNAAISTAFVRLSQGAQVLIPKVDSVAGTFNESVTAGTWEVQTTATNYVQNFTNVTVSAGNGTVVPLTLVPQTSTTCGTAGNPACPPPSCQSTNTCPSNSTPSNGLSTLEIAAIAVVAILVVAVLVAVVMMRGRRGGGGGGSEGEYNQNPPDQPVYEATPTSDLSKLQSDGSMSGGSPPPGAQ